MSLKLEAKSREVIGKRVYSLRQNGKIPAVIYGHGVQNRNLELIASDFEKIYKEAGSNTIIDLMIDGGDPIKVLITDIQNDSVSGLIIHADFKQIRMDEKITAHVKVNLIGEAPAVKTEGGVLVNNLSEVEIKCLPNDLIHSIEVNISSLVTFDDVITVADLKLPDAIELVGHELEDVVATVTAPKEEEEPIVTEPVEGEEGEEGVDDEVKADGENQSSPIEGKKSVEGEDTKSTEEDNKKE